MNDYVTDNEGTQLEVGARVYCGDRPEGGRYVGFVTRITESDGDVDDEGRTIGINPHVTVEGEDWEDDFTTLWHGNAWAAYMGADECEFRCEDVTIEHPPIAEQAQEPDNVAAFEAAAERRAVGA